MMAKREIPTQREKHCSYDLRFKLRAVGAKNSIITAAVQEFEVDITINACFEEAPISFQRPLYRCC